MVMIKEMQMPKTCGQCSLKDYSESVCVVKCRKISRYVCLGNAPRPTWCPLTEVEAYGPTGILYREK